MHITKQGDNPNCAQVSEVAYKRGPCKQRHINGHGQKKLAKAKQGHYVNKGCKCSRCCQVHDKEDRCAARNVECRNCRKLGCFAVLCRPRAVNEVTAPYEE